MHVFNQTDYQWSLKVSLFHSIPNRRWTNGSLYALCTPNKGHKVQERILHAKQAVSLTVVQKSTKLAEQSWPARFDNPD